MPAAPLLRLRGLRREFPSGGETIAALDDISLDIRAGEMLAIVGPSGSGKSTLMNILGCLDRASGGSYQVAGREVGRLDADQLAALRRSHFGFVFQRYHLLGEVSAQANVEMPAVYAGLPAPRRRQRARALLARLGLADRGHHRPGQLSGGQQQRTSIARALMNGGPVLLADEPTGALDSTSGQEVLAILRELHADGHTVIVVTHDMQVAAHAERIIELHDGRLVSDRANTPPPLPAATPRDDATPPPGAAGGGRTRSARARLSRLREALGMALLALATHRLRSALTMLGIIIGIAAVVSVVALGEASRQAVRAEIASLGTNVINIRAGTGWADRFADRTRTLLPGDAEALAQQSYVDSVTPLVSSSPTFRFGNAEAAGRLQGVGAAYFQVNGLKLAAGALFDAQDVHGVRQLAVIDDNARQTFFERSDPLGQVLFIDRVPLRVIGVLQPAGNNYDPGSQGVNVYVPYTTAMRRITGQNFLSGITVRVSDAAPLAAAEAGITELLTRRHGREDFFLMNVDGIRQAIDRTSRVMTLLIAAIAVIALLVGGIGVMNIMLVSVTERTAEIGLRMAVGARQGDVRLQFLIEAVLVCALGGALGITAALAGSALFNHFVPQLPLAHAPLTLVLALLGASLVGVAFGYLPARAAARLDPVVALTRD